MSGGVRLKQGTCRAGVPRSSRRESLRSCAIITGEPNELVAKVYTRMPVILPEEHRAKWLGEEENGDLKELLKPFPAERMQICQSVCR